EITPVNATSRHLTENAQTGDISDDVVPKSASENLPDLHTPLTESTSLGGYAPIQDRQDPSSKPPGISAEPGVRRGSPRGGPGLIEFSRNRGLTQGFSGRIS